MGNQQFNKKRCSSKDQKQDYHSVTSNKLEYETESTESQYFISDADAWNTLRKQLATTARGCAVLYIKENCELPIINNTVLAKKRNFDCWKPVCAGQISKDFGEI